MSHPLVLFVANALSYLLLVLDYRAVAQGSIPRTVAANVLIAGLSFSMVRAIGKADSVGGHIAYVAGGVIGSVLALLLSPYIEVLW